MTLDAIEQFTYVENMLTTTGGIDQDVEDRLGKARSVFMGTG